MLRAVIVTVPAVLGAVKTPADVIVPAVADHVTDLFLAPVTVADRVRLRPVVTVKVSGRRVTAMAETFTVDDADAEVSPTLVAVTV